MDTERTPADAQNGVVLDADMFEGLKVRCFLFFVVVDVCVCMCVHMYICEEAECDGFFFFFFLLDDVSFSTRLSVSCVTEPGSGRSPETECRR